MNKKIIKTTSTFGELLMEKYDYDRLSKENQDSLNKYVEKELALLLLHNQDHQSFK